MGKTVLDELTNYSAWQMEKYGNIVPGIESTPEGDLLNSGLEELNRMAEWISCQSQQFMEHLPMITRTNDWKKKKWRISRRAARRNQKRNEKI